MRDEITKLLHSLRRVEGVLAIFLIIVFLALSFLVGVLLVPTVRAAEPGAEPAEFTLTATQNFESDGLSTPPSETFTYRLTAQNGGAPLPEGSDPDTYTFTMRGTEVMRNGPIRYNSAGAYSYTLECVTEDKPGYTIDRRMYLIEVYVPEDLSTVTVIYKNSHTKVSDIMFEHMYKTASVPPGIITPPPGTPPPPPGTPPPPPGEPNLPPDTLFPPPGVPASPPDNLIPIPAEPTLPGNIEESPSDPNLTLDNSGPHPGGFKPGEESPKTSDDSKPMLWAMLIVISSALLLLLAWSAWKLHRIEKQVA